MRSVSREAPVRSRFAVATSRPDGHRRRRLRVPEIRHRASRGACSGAVCGGGQPVEATRARAHAGAGRGAGRFRRSDRLVTRNRRLDGVGTRTRGRHAVDGRRDRRSDRSKEAARRGRETCHRPSAAAWVEPAWRSKAYHSWLELPEAWRAEPFVAAAARLGIAITAAAAFAVGSGHAPNAVRLALASPSTESLAALGALATLAASKGPSTNDVCVLGVEAPARQGARSAHTGSMQATSNAARRDASAARM